MAYRADWNNDEILTAEDLNDTFRKASVKTNDFVAHCGFRYKIEADDIKATLYPENFQTGWCCSFFVLKQNFRLYAPSNFIAKGNQLFYENLTLNPKDLAHCFYFQGGPPWVISSFNYTGISFSVGSQDTIPRGLFFKPDGTKMYIVGDNTNRVYQYTLSTPWNVGTASYDNVSFYIGNQDIDPQGLFFKPDGTKMYIVGDNTNRVYQYTLSTPWNVGTASYDNVSFYVGSQNANPKGVFFKPDGTKMYMIGEDADKVYQYTLSTPWNVGTASYDNISFDVGNQDGAPKEVFFKPDGTKMYIVGDSTDTIYQYTLSTPWNVGTASYDNISLYVGSQDSLPNALFIREDGNRLYLLGESQDRVYQYTANYFIVKECP